MPAIEQAQKQETTIPPQDSTLPPQPADVSVDEPKKKKPNPVLLAGLVMAIVLVVGGSIWWVQSNGKEETDDAYVEGHISYVSPRIASNVTQVMVDENQRVKTGQLLIVLDSKDQQADLAEATASQQEAVDQATAAQSKIRQTDLSAQGQTSQAMGDISTVQADISSARSAVLQAKDSVRQAEARVREERAKEEFSRSDFERYKTAWANSAVTKQAYDKASQSLDMAIATKEQAEQNLRQSRKLEVQAEAKVQSEIGRLDKSKGMLTTAQSMQAEKAVDEAQYKSSLASENRYKANVEAAQLKLSYTKIWAPVDGRIGKKSVEVGQRVEPGQALFSIVQDDCWIIANFKETQVGKMRQGQPVEIKIDSFPNHTFTGKVDSLGPASGAKFSMLPPDNATGNFTKIVQRIPIKIKFDQSSVGEFKSRISPGMSCLVTVETKK
ncbi:MAG TPA: HlyD family secretion protein [Planktothrix sp.]|jgi:membrane fusion protein (multidrug efflux system)